MNHCNMDHRLTRCDVTLIVLAVPPVSPKPAERPLDNPTLGQHHKPFDPCRSQHSLQQPSEGVFDTFGQVISAVCAVGEDHFQPMEPFFESAENSQDQHRSILVLNIGRMDDERQDQTQRIDNDMALTSVDLLSGIVTSLAADLGRLDRLTVDNRRARGLLASQATPKHVPERVVNPLPSPVVAPTEEDPINCLPVGEFVRQKPPGAATADNIDDRVEDGATADRLGRPAARRLRQKFSKDLPLLVGQVREIFGTFRVGDRYDSFRSVVGNRRDSYRLSLI